MPVPKGYKQTAEHKARRSDSLRQHYIDYPEARVEKGNERRQYYIDHPEEGSKIAERMKQFWARLSIEEKRERCRKGCEIAVSMLKGKPQSDAVIEARRQGMIGHPVSERARVKMSVAGKKRWNAEYRAWQVSAGKKRWQDPQFVARVMASRNAKPNKAELLLDSIIQKACPGEYEYTGDGKISLHGLIPDWFNINGKKAVIELFGDYWHSPEVIENRWQRSELGRLMAYNSLGFKCLVIWEHELKDEKTIITKIQRFNAK